MPPAKVSHGIYPTSHSEPVLYSFDRESGQLFEEREVRFNKKQHSNWIAELKSPSLYQSRQRPNEKGVRSLFDTTKNQVAKQFPSLTVAHLAGAVPWAIAEEVWKEVVSTRAESFHAWRTMARAYGEDFGDPRYRYKLDIRTPPLPLPEYFHGISSATTSWLTCLRISPKQVTSTDLIAIAQIPNLAILDLSDGQVAIDRAHSTFSERIMRTWAELASSSSSTTTTSDPSAGSSGAFQHLRVLMLGWQEHLSEWLFKYLPDFPSLCHVIVTDCAHLHQKNRWEWQPEARIHRWEARHQKRSAKSLRPILDESGFHLGAVSACYYESQTLFERLDHPRRPDLTQRLPLLECWIGNPRSWTHIIDEFPGTRTIWFDNARVREETYEELVHRRVGQVSDQPPFKRGHRLGLSLENESRSSPAKRAQARVKHKTAYKTTEDLLLELGHGQFH